jgi:hypothetical protein
MGQLMDFMYWQKLAHVMFFLSFFYFFGLVLLDYISRFFLFLHITNVSPRLAPYYLKGEKWSVALSSLITLKTMLATKP